MHAILSVPVNLSRIEVRHRPKCNSTNLVLKSLLEKMAETIGGLAEAARKRKETLLALRKKSGQGQGAVSMSEDAMSQLPPFFEI